MVGLKAVVAAAALVVAAGSVQAQDTANCTLLAYVPEGFGDARINPQGSCSGHGSCEVLPTKQQCACEEGWNGRGDFVNTEGFDCQMSDLGLRIVWGINTFALVVYFFIGLPRVLLRWRQHKETAVQRADQGAKYSIKQNRGLLACFAYNCICVPAMLGMGVLMQVAPEQRIGLDFGATLFFALNKTGFYLAIWLFQPALLSTILKGKSSTLHLVKINDRASLLLCTVAVILAYLPFATLFISDGADTLAVLVFYLVMAGTWLQVVCLFGQALYVKKKVIRVLNQSLSLTHSERTVKIKKALVDIQNGNMKQTVVQGLVFALFVCYPYMMNKHAYFLPISWIGYVVVGKNLAFTAVSSESGNSKSFGTSSAAASKSKSNKDKSFSMSEQPATVLNTRFNSSYVDSSYQRSFQENVVSYHENLAYEGPTAGDGDDEYV